MRPEALALVLLALLAGAASAAAEELLIDDFEDGDLEARPGLSWMVIADDLVGGTSGGRLTAIDPGAAGTAGALALAGETAAGFAAPFAGVWTAVAGDGRPLDLTAYTGLRFLARGSGGTFRAGLRRGTGGGTANFMASFPAGPEWAPVDLPFSSLAALPPHDPAPQWSAADVSWIGFTTAPGTTGPFRLEIDEVRLYGREVAATSRAGASTPTRRVRLTDASTLAGLAWKPLATDAAGDGTYPRLPDVRKLSWASAPDGFVWFRLDLEGALPERWMGVNVAVAGEADSPDGMAWWGANKAFRFERIVTAYLTRGERTWQGWVGVGSAQAMGRGVADDLSAGVRAAVDRERPAFLVGVPRAALPSGRLRLLGAVGSSMAFNDDLPNEGAATLDLPSAGGS
jgi:hypothetical protein